MILTNSENKCIKYIIEGVEYYYCMTYYPEKCKFSKTNDRSYLCSYRRLYKCTNTKAYKTAEKKEI